MQTEKRNSKREREKERESKRGKSQRVNKKDIKDGIQKMRIK